MEDKNSFGFGGRKKPMRIPYKFIINIPKKRRCKYLFFLEIIQTYKLQILILD